MPRFETDGETYLEITPKEFYEKCRLAEQTDMCEIIMNDFNLLYTDEVDAAQTPHRSYSHMKFDEALYILNSVWPSLSKIDVDIIKEIAKRNE